MVSIPLVVQVAIVVVQPGAVLVAFHIEQPRVVVAVSFVYDTIYCTADLTQLTYIRFPHMLESYVSQEMRDRAVFYVGSKSTNATHQVTSFLKCLHIPRYL